MSLFLKKEEPGRAPVSYPTISSQTVVFVGRAFPLLILGETIYQAVTKHRLLTPISLTSRKLHGPRIYRKLLAKMLEADQLEMIKIILKHFTNVEKGLLTWNVVRK